MPPKKVVKTLDKTIQEKVKRRRTRKEKCLPLSETGENMKIQDIDVSYNDQQKDRLVSLKKNDINIILANEVVGRQFKKQTKLKDPAEAIVLNILKQPTDKLNMKKKTVLKRKTPLKNNKVQKKDSINCDKEPVRKIGRRRIPPKRFEDVLEIIEECDSPKDIIETGPVLCQNETKKPIKLRRNKNLPKLDLVENNVTSEENLDTPKSKTPRRKVSLNRNIARGRPRTRKKADDDIKESQMEAITTENVTSQIETIENVKKQDILDVRRNSLASLSELSWTKDISSSSTTTCVTVCSNDFFRIDKRIPIIKLTNVDHKLIGEENNNVSNGATETIAEQYEDVSKEPVTAHCTELNEKHCIDEVDCPCPKSPNLSSSSSDSCSDRSKSGQNVSTAINKLSNTLEKLSSKLKNFDLEIINWIGYTDDKINSNIEKIQDKIYHDNFLKEEMNVIIHCKNIKRILSENDPSTEPPEFKKTDNNVIETDRDNETHKNATLPEPHKPIEDKFNSPKEPLKILSNIIVQRKTCKEMDTVENKSEDDCNYASLDEDDEDDALSLFAESITGIEPSARNSAASCGTECPKEIEEYVPEPLVKNNSTSLISNAYHPTRITNNAQLKDPEDESILVCEKQSADSTSINREQENDKNLVETSNSFKIQSKDVEEISRKPNGVTKLISQNQLLMSSMYKPISGVKSIVFKGVCFYNLISNCKKNGCNFPHVPVGIDSVKTKLKVYSDATLIQEYMLMRNWPSLRQKYGMCFVEEFVKRNLSKIVVEVALDFIIKDNNNALIVDIVEYVLLYLNMVDLSSIEDLLTFNIKASTTLLCDIFISTIAQSQNFSRFKSVFINLTDLMYRIGRSFSEDVAGHVLERLVILPYDEGLARALIKIIRNTDVSIYSNSMVGHLEQQLLSSNISLYEEFMSLKNKALSQSALDSCYIDVERSKQLDKDVRCSPDTTNLDNMNKSSVETKFTRTIDLNKINFLNTNSQVTEIKNDKRYNHSKQFMSWRDRNSYGNTRTVPRNTAMRPPLRPPFKRRSDQKFDGSPSKYQRRNGSNFFKDFS
ncbi:uncharacterized protein LOC125071921 isoform X2 [Vanessa atalanta]|uniref:uncharacterized protein LOC125071921 isoform X2 n=1 Tax=Vanessa atalanta TaxID=42275 RepID=UPI001FCD2DED|nr:uncharacterized protein LOC125071921 isoform X2 [Vanessa atalanta]